MSNNSIAAPVNGHVTGAQIRIVAVVENSVLILWMPVKGI